MYWGLFLIKMHAWIIESYFNSLVCLVVLISEIIPIHNIHNIHIYIHNHTGIHCYILICNLMFTFLKFLSFILFWQIWSQNLKFFKLTKIWYRGRLLYSYFDFDVYFFKLFVSHIFLGKYGLKIWSSQIGWNLVEGCITICLLRF